MQPLHETAAQSANTSHTGAPTESAPQSLPIHASAAIFPPMRESEFEALVADIREKGQLEAIWLWQGQVIDGRHRVLACQKLGLTPKTREWDGQGSLLEFIVSANLRRRHLKENQRAMVAARMIPEFEEEAFKRKQTGGVVDSNQGTNWSPGKTRHVLGKIFHVSGTSVDRARRLLQNGIPELVSKVDLGVFAVSMALKIAEFPPDEQTRLLTLNRRELAAKFRPAKPERPAAKPEQPVQETTIDKVHFQDQKFIAELYSGSARLKRCPEGLRLKLSERNWRTELINIMSQQSFANLLSRGFVIFRSDEAIR